MEKDEQLIMLEHNFDLSFSSNDFEIQFTCAMIEIL